MWQKLKNIYHLGHSFAASIIYKNPSKALTVIAVTGTDGKTTTANMIYHILSTSKERCAMITSLGATVENAQIDTGFHVSTPNPWQIQKLMKRAKDRNCRYFVIEATSHGLDQNRLAFVQVNTAVLTNITNEHMDYHKNWKNYAKAKAKLFKNAKYAILNLDDTASYAYLRTKIKGKIFTYSQYKKADFNLINYPLKININGSHNLSNALAACAASASQGLKKPTILNAIKTFKGTKGRMEQVLLGQQFDAIIDFAHTPNALELTLKTLKPINPKNRLIAVFGSAGQRDKQKRPIMGEIAARYADISVITSEDPRTEDAANIAKEISIGFKKTGKLENEDFFKVQDRKKAIQFAINMAKKGDTVVFLGKGHEKSMTVGKKEYAWDERREVENAVKKYIKNEK